MLFLELAVMRMVNGWGVFGGGHRSLDRAFFLVYSFYLLARAFGEIRRARRYLCEGHDYLGMVFFAFGTGDCGYVVTLGICGRNVCNGEMWIGKFLGCDLGSVDSTVFDHRIPRRLFWVRINR
jgi:hypothetical protein